MQKPKPDGGKIRPPLESEAVQSLSANIRPLLRRPDNLTLNTDNSSQCDAFSSSKAEDRTTNIVPCLPASVLKIDSRRRGQRASGGEL